MLQPNKNFLLSCIESLLLYNAFLLWLHTLYIQVMLILVLINVWCLLKVVFSFEKGLNSQNQSSDSYHLMKKSPIPNKISHPTERAFPCTHQQSVTPCLSVSVQLGMEWITIKKHYLENPRWNKKIIYDPFLWVGFSCPKARATSRRQLTFYH